MNTIDRTALVSENLNEYVSTNEGLRRLSSILDESQSARCPHTTEQDRSITLADEALTVGELMDCRSDLFTTAKLTHAEMMNAFRDATSGKRVNMTVNEVVALVDGIEAETHAEAVNEILIELGWKERE